MAFQFLISAIFCLAMWAGSMARDLEWWETTIIYQIYPQSFKDSNGDGTGDLKGIIEKLDYLKDIGVETIWIQPFYESPMIDTGYDVSNYREINPLFGTIEDYKVLVKGIHDRGMKILIDFVPNHVSDQHEWFKLSVDRVDPYTDYFIWVDPKIDSNNQTTIPNNWLSEFGGSAWTWNEKRKQYYFHEFSENQVDLNLRNPKVREELSNVLRFWLDMGTDGFRMDAVAFMFEAEHLKDEVRVCPTPSEAEIDGFCHFYTMHLPENIELLHQRRMLMKEYEEKDGKVRLLSTEDTGPNIQRLVKYIGNDTYPNVQIPFYFGLTLRINDKINATEWNSRILDWVTAQPKNALPNWVLNSHDTCRVSTRLDANSVDAVNMIFLLLPGTVNIYYGSEIGLPDSKLRPDQKKDNVQFWDYKSCGVSSRDPARGPMSWDDTINAGFTTNQKPWLPVSTHYWKFNVKTQMQEQNSHLKIFKRLTTLRKTPAVKYGDLHTYVLSEWLLMFIRNFTTAEGTDAIVVICNLGTESEQICGKNFQPALPETMFVHTSSLNAGFNIGDKVKISNADGKMCTELRPRAGLVLTANQGTCFSHSLYLIFLAVCANMLRRINY